MQIATWVTTKSHPKPVMPVGRQMREYPGPGNASQELPRLLSQH